MRVIVGAIVKGPMNFNMKPRIPLKPTMICNMEETIIAPWTCKTKAAKSESKTFCHFMVILNIFVCMSYRPTLTNRFIIMFTTI